MCVPFGCFVHCLPVKYGALLIGITVETKILRCSKTQGPAATGVSKPLQAGGEGGVASSGLAPNPTAEVDVDDHPPKIEGAPKAAAAAAAAEASPRSDASDAPSSVGVSGFTGCDESGVYDAWVVVVRLVLLLWC